MILLFFQVSLSILKLDDNIFKSNILNQELQVPWFVMFGNSNCPSCAYSFPEFEKISNMASDFIAFGYADTQLTKETAMSLGVFSVPSFFLFTNNGTYAYNGKRTASNFMSFISDVLSEGIEETDESWADQKDNMVIMFTRRYKPPIYYSAAYNILKNKNIKFGLTRDSDVIEAFGNPTTPSIWFYKNMEKVKYDGKQEFTNFISSIFSFFDIDDTQKIPNFQHDL